MDADIKENNPGITSNGDKKNYPPLSRQTTNKLKRLTIIGDEDEEACKLHEDEQEKITKNIAITGQAEKNCTNTTPSVLNDKAEDSINQESNKMGVKRQMSNNGKRISRFIQVGNVEADTRKNSQMIQIHANSEANPIASIDSIPITPTNLREKMRQSSVKKSNSLSKRNSETKSSKIELFEAAIVYDDFLKASTTDLKSSHLSTIENANISSKSSLKQINLSKTRSLTSMSSHLSRNSLLKLKSEFDLLMETKKPQESTKSAILPLSKSSLSRGSLIQIKSGIKGSSTKIDITNLRNSIAVDISTMRSKKDVQSPETKTKNSDYISQAEQSLQAQLHELINISSEANITVDGSKAHNDFLKSTISAKVSSAAESDLPKINYHQDKRTLERKTSNKYVSKAEKDLLAQFDTILLADSSNISSHQQKTIKSNESEDQNIHKCIQSEVQSISASNEKENIMKPNESIKRKASDRSERMKGLLDDLFHDSSSSVPVDSKAKGTFPEAADRKRQSDVSITHQGLARSRSLKAGPVRDPGRKLSQIMKDVDVLFKESLESASNEPINIVPAKALGIKNSERIKILDELFQDSTPESDKTSELSDKSKNNATLNRITTK